MPVTTTSDACTNIFPDVKVPDDDPQITKVFAITVWIIAVAFSCWEKLASASVGKTRRVSIETPVSVPGHGAGGAGVGGGVGLVPSLTVTVVAHPCKTNRPAHESAANVHPRIAAAGKPGDVFQAILEPRL